MAVTSIGFLIQHLAIEDPKLHEALIAIENAVLKKGSININQLGSTVSQGAGPAGPAGPRGNSGGIIDPTSEYFEYDDFLLHSVPLAISTSDLFGKLGWLFFGNNTGAGISGIATREAGHPGIIALQCQVPTHSFAYMLGSKTTVNSGADYSGLVITDLWDITFIVRCPRLGANADQRIGIVSDIGSTGGSLADPLPKPSEGAYFELLAADTNWFTVCRTGGATQTRTDTTVVAARANWIRLRVRRIDTGTIAFSINGATEILITTNLPSAGITYPAYGPAIIINNPTGLDDGDGLGTWMLIDYVSITVTGLSR